MAIEMGLPDDLKRNLELVKIARHLNQGMQTSYYNPETLKKMAIEDIDNLVMAITLENVS